LTGPFEGLSFGEWRRDGPEHRRTSRGSEAKGNSEGKELANIAGKMISSAKVQVEYYALRKEAPSISFLTAKTKR
jgi:hypothetical protein